MTDAPRCAGQDERLAVPLLGGLHGYERPGAHGARGSSWIEPALRKAREEIRAFELQPVMQAERPVLPELDGERLDPGNRTAGRRRDAETRPVGRPWPRADRVACGVAGHRLFQSKPAFEWPRLLGRPGADPA